MDLAAIQRNKQARSYVELIVGLAEETLKDGAEIVNPQRFWELLAKEAATKAGLQVIVDSSKPMTQEEAVKFEYQPMTYGKYLGIPISDVPAEYLSWLCENEFSSLLQRYIQSPRFQQRQQEEPF